jgi:hypothetical protein
LFKEIQYVRWKHAVRAKCSTRAFDEGIFPEQSAQKLTAGQLPSKADFAPKDYSLPQKTNTSFRETAIYFHSKDSQLTNSNVFNLG